MRIIIILSLFFCCTGVFAQDLKTEINDNKKQRDSLRTRLDGNKDTVIFNSKYITFTTLALSKDSIQTLPLDTTLVGFQNFSPLYQPRTPTKGTGNLGLAAVPMLFDNSKIIGFDAGFHALDYYMLKHEDIKFYRARTPFSSLYYVTSGDAEQVFKVIHSQNITKNWNVGLNFNRNGANGKFTHQRGDDLNVGISSWYQTKNKQYTLFASAVINTLKAQENGSIKNETIYSADNFNINRLAEATRLTTANQLWRTSSYQFKNIYLLNKIDTTTQGNKIKRITPSNKITYTVSYSKNSFNFKKNETDATHDVIPKGKVDSVYTNDSTSVKHLQNEIMYSFVLQRKSSSFIKNELKISAGLRHDYYDYIQLSKTKTGLNALFSDTQFQNVSLLGNAGYRFSDRVDLNFDVQQIVQGKNIGDLLYEAKTNVLLSKLIGIVEMKAYFQNKSPEEIYDNYSGNHYTWQNNFGKTKITNFSFKYLNPKIRFDITASYYLLNNYLFFSGDNHTTVHPDQYTGNIHLIKIAVGKKISVRNFNLDSYLVYQNTNQNTILRIPEFYTFNSLYFHQTFFKVLKTQIGVDVRYNTDYLASAYAPAINQFYNTGNATMTNKPVADVWMKLGLRRANLFVKYEYVNQGVFSRGFYTINRYPMPDRMLKWGVIWNFYD